MVCITRAGRRSTAEGGLADMAQRQRGRSNHRPTRCRAAASYARRNGSGDSGHAAQAFESRSASDRLSAALKHVDQHRVRRAPDVRCRVHTPVRSTGQRARNRRARKAACGFRCRTRRHGTACARSVQYSVLRQHHAPHWHCLFRRTDDRAAAAVGGDTVQLRSRPSVHACCGYAVHRRQSHEARRTILPRDERRCVQLVAERCTGHRHQRV